MLSSKFCPAGSEQERRKAEIPHLRTCSTHNFKYVGTYLAPAPKPTDLTTQVRLAPLVTPAGVEPALPT